MNDVLRFTDCLATKSDSVKTSQLRVSKYLGPNVFKFLICLFLSVGNDDDEFLKPITDIV